MATDQGAKHIKTHAFGQSTEMAAVYCLAGDALEAQVAEMAPMILPEIANGHCRPFVLTWCCPVDWNRDYTPWPAPPLNAKADPFDGDAPALLEWMRAEWVPYMQQSHGIGPENSFVLGYSLGGLCALWLLYASDLFRGGASCSGSLWYDGWGDFMQAHTLQRKGSRVYLSLGKKEENARSPRMAAVGDATRAAHALFRQDSQVAQSILEWHAGGHFTDIPTRMAQALLWLMRP